MIPLKNKLLFLNIFCIGFTLCMEREIPSLDKSEREEIPEIPKDVLKYHIFYYLLKSLIEENVKSDNAIKQLSAFPFPFKISRKFRNDVIKIIKNDPSFEIYPDNLLEAAIRNNWKELYNYIINLVEIGKIQLTLSQINAAMHLAQKSNDLELISKLQKIKKIVEPYATTSWHGYH